MVEGGFGKIMLGRHGLHDAIRQRRLKRHYRGRIAREGAGGDGINQEKGKFIMPADRMSAPAPQLSPQTLMERPAIAEKGSLAVLAALPAALSACAIR